MSLPWVKLHTTLVHNRDYRQFTAGAKLTFVTCLMLAGDLDQGDFSGRLASKSGPVTLEELAGYTGMRTKMQQQSLDELVKIGFLSKDFSGAYIVERFNEKAAPISALSTDRVRRHRDRNRNGSETLPETGEKRFGNTAEAEVEAELYASLRSAAFGNGDGNVSLPSDRVGLQALAFVLLARFANIHDPVKATKYVGTCTTVLREISSKGVTISGAWTACETAWEDGVRRPLYGPRLASALRTALATKPTPARKSRANDRGTELDRDLETLQRKQGIIP